MAKKYTPCLNDSCFFTEAPPKYCEVHHIFFGNDRSLSEKYGMKIYVIPHWHKFQKHAIHMNRETDLKVKLYGKAKFEEMYPDLDIRNVFDCTWLMEVDE